VHIGVKHRDWSRFFAISKKACGRDRDRTESRRVRRPDIAAAERTLVKDNAIIGIRYDAFFPNVTLTADGGFESSTFEHLLQWPSRFWSIGPSISQTISWAGMRRAWIHTSTCSRHRPRYFPISTLAGLQIQQMVSAVNLFEALGGGWDRLQLPTPSQVTHKSPASDYKLQH